MRVLLAFDKFKDSMSAPDACAAAAAAIRGCRPEWIIDQCPIADGGEGFAEILTVAARGELLTVDVPGPRGEPVAARFGIVDAGNVPPAARSRIGVAAGDRVAVVELAAASGLALLSPDRRDVWHTSTTGTGELLKAAERERVGAIVLGVGGSATNDVGLGALTALGLKLLNAEGDIVAASPASWLRLAKLEGKPALAPRLFIACDVTNPLVGPLGAATVYGPQKGLRPESVARLDHETAHVGRMLCAHFGRADTLMNTPGAGAAGGTALGLMTAFGATLLPGFAFVSDWLDLESRIAAADLVVSGEGRVDETSFSGKSAMAVAQQAIALGKLARVFTGAVVTSRVPPSIDTHVITPEGTPLDEALRDGPENLTATVQAVLGRHED